MGYVIQVFSWSGTHFEETMYEASQLEHKQYKYNYLLKL